ncbi:hypothetical protein R6Q57_000013 [Mikania cordata]
MMLMMMMIMIAGFVDSIVTPIKSWLETETNTNMRLKEVGADSPRVDCIVCLSEVALGDTLAVLQSCRHGFHVDCVEAWLKDHPNCPLCRTPAVTHAHLSKSYEIMTRFGFHVLETISTWLTSSFSQGLHSSLSESCTYL